MNPEEAKPLLTIPNTNPSEVMIAICRMCGGKIPYTDPDGVLACMGLKLKPNLCNACNEIREQQQADALIAGRVQAWRQLCPPLYQETDLHHEGMPEPHVQARILEWKFKPKGLLVRGISGIGKSRLCWLLLRRLMMEGLSVRGLTSSQFASRLAAAYRSEDADAPREFFESMTRCRVLFIDDFGKFKLTERVEQDLYEVIEERCANKLPLIVTTNLVGERLLAMMDPDRGEPLVRRLREFCEDVAL